MQKKPDHLLLLWSGDIESNPGPAKTASICFCHWHLNSITAHNFSKLTLLKAIATSSQYDIICLSETFLDSSIESDDKRLNIEGYNLIRADHPRNKKREGVCMYYKDYLRIIRRDDLCTFQECVVAEIKLESRGVKVAFLHVFKDLKVKTKTTLNFFVVTLTYLFPN